MKTVAFLGSGHLAFAGGGTGLAIDPWTWEEILGKRDLIRQCVPARIRDELLRDLKGGAAQPFFRLMFESRLFYAIFPGWKKRLGPAGETSLLHFMGRLDPLMQAERPLSETQVWALFLTRTTLSTSSFMGVIMMVGIVVSNGVLLVDYTNVLRTARHAAAGGGAHRRAHTAATDLDDDAGDGLRLAADGARLGGWQ